MGVGKINVNEQLVTTVPYIEDSAHSDFDITDDNNNTIARFVDGRLITKKPAPFSEDDASNDFEINDEDKNTILAVRNGNLITKNFNSFVIQKIITDYINNNSDEKTFINEINSIFQLGTPEVCLSIHDEEATGEDNMYMGYMQVMKINDSLYYMYYDANGTDTPRDSSGYLSDYRNCIKFAYSADGINWVRDFPDNIENPPQTGINACQFLNRSGERIGIGSVCILKAYWDKDYPFRAIQSDGSTFIWKSVDGVTFIEQKLIEDIWRDCQPSAIIRGNTIKIYCRNKPPKYGREIGVLYCDLDGNLLSPGRYMFGEGNLYQSSAGALDERRDILFPTTFPYSVEPHNPEGINCYIIDGNEVIPVPIDEDIFTANRTFKSLYAQCGGLVDINHEQYLYYSCSEKYHDDWQIEPVVPSYENQIRRIKITFN